MARAANPDDKVLDVVLLVPGIRDFGRWTKVVGKQITDALPGVRVGRANIGFFGLVQFLVPLPIFRTWAIKRVIERYREMKSRYRNARISFIAHSFGSFCVAEMLRTEADIEAHRVVFCGSVVKRDYPFNLFHHRFALPLLNDVGTADAWPAVAEALAFGCGSIGTFGFGDSAYVTDRFHNGAKHGYYFQGTFAKDHWVPFLRDGTIVPGSDEPAPPPRHISIIGRIHIKVILCFTLLLGAAVLVLKLLNGPIEFYANAVVPSVSREIEGEGLVSLYPWKTIVSTLADEMGKICPWGGAACPPEPMQHFLWGREFDTALAYNDDLKNVSSCTPYDPSAVMVDPVAAIKDFQEAFPTCMAVTQDPNNLHWRPVVGANHLVPSRDGTTLYCGCSTVAIQAFSN